MYEVHNKQIFYHRGPAQSYYCDELIANNRIVDLHIKSLGSKSTQVKMIIFKVNVL